MGPRGVAICPVSYETSWGFLEPESVCSSVVLQLNGYTDCFPGLFPSQEHDTAPTKFGASAGWLPPDTSAKLPFGTVKITAAGFPDVMQLRVRPSYIFKNLNRCLKSLNTDRSTGQDSRQAPDVHFRCAKHTSQL